MAKRDMDKIKDFRGSKRAVQKETAEWLAGNIGSIPTRAGRKRTPPFQVEAIAALTKKPKGKQSSKTQPKQSKRATEVVPAPATNLPPITQTEPHTPTASHVPTTMCAATVRVSQDSTDDDESGPDDDKGDVNLLDNSDVEDAEVQVIVTPRRPLAQLPHDEQEMTVQQYKLVIADYQDRLLRAERQIRAISKTHLADKFMENEVRKYVKESLWKRCKFITSAETMEHCMTEVATHFSIASEKREHWKSTYAHSVRDALNNRRNNTAQDLKKELAGK